MNRSAEGGGQNSVKRFERSNGLDTALYKNYLYLFLIALTCIFSSISNPSCNIVSMPAYSILEVIYLTIALYRVTVYPFSLHVALLRIIPIIWLPLEAAILHCSETFMLAFSIVTSSYFPFTVLHRIVRLTSCSLPFHSSSHFMLPPIS